MRFTKAQIERAVNINSKLRTSGSSQSDIARRLEKQYKRKFSQQAVWNVVWSVSESRLIKNEIVKVTGERIEDLWPEDDDEERAA